MVTCYIGIGSNLGDRQANIRKSVKKINSLKGTKIIKLSRIIETYPVGGPKKQRKFLNAALKIKTSLTPLNLLKNLKKIELELGRTKSLRWGPRAIDLDILFYSGKSVNTKSLLIPHPRIFQRDFVIRPLLEIL